MEIKYYRSKTKAVSYLKRPSVRQLVLLFLGRSEVALEFDFIVTSEHPVFLQNVESTIRIVPTCKAKEEI